MNDTRQELLLALFSEACDLGPAEQAALIDARCAGDPELARELRALLDEDAQGHPELDSPAVEHVRPSAPAAELPETIGHYRILRLIGAGGMGVVYEAEQDRPRRRVALKVIRPGLTSPDHVRRFEHEAEVLGWLDHPGVARVFEAGTADTGAGPQPFFAMELVEGVPLTAYAEREGLSVAGRLELLARVCEAVHHAHQKGVVHRDLKPGNVLVDAAGQPKVLDFGVARVTDADLRATTLQTRTGELIGTLRYMSPEQVAARPEDVDTRSDVYALGVIAYELLSGRSPHDLERRQLHEAARAIVEDEPSSLSGIDRSLAGDVETIVLKALEKDRTRRYASAEELGSDIRRWLRHEPIVARPPSALYQLRKFARRNRGLVGAIAAVFVVLLVASLVSTTQFLEAESARADAEDRLEALAELNEFFHTLLVSPMPQESGANVRVLDVLDAKLPEIEAAFPDRPLQRAWLLEAVGNSYGAVAEVERAADLLRRAHDLRAANELAPTRELLRGKVFLALALVYRDEVEEARRLVEEGLALLPAVGDAPLLAARLHNARLRVLLRTPGGLAQAVADGERSLALLATDPGGAAFVAEFRSDLSVALERDGRLEEAERQARLALDEALAHAGERSGRTCQVRSRLAGVLRARGRLEESVELQREALAGYRALVGEENATYVNSLANIATTLRMLQRRGEAEEVLREVVRIARDMPADADQGLQAALVNLGSLCIDNGKPLEAEELLAEALAVEPGDHASLAMAHAYMGRIQQFGGDQELAREHYEAAYELNVQSPGHGSIVECQGLGILAMNRGDTEEAVLWYRRAFEGATAGRDVVDFNACNVLGPLIANLMELGRTDEAMELSSAHWEGCAAAYERSTAMPAQFEAQHGWLLILHGQIDEGLEHLAFGSDELNDILGDRHPTARTFDERLERAMQTE